LLHLLNDRSSLPWLCAGDFNEVLEAAEQFGGNVRPERQMDGFREAVTVCGFTDLGFSRLPFTWDNRQNGAHNVKVRLDRGLANRDFLDMFPVTTVWHEQTTTSDHCCLRIESYQHGTNRRRRCKPFRYENMWRRDESYVDLIRSAWGEADGSTDLNQLKVRLSRVQGALWDWDKNVFGSVRKNLKKLRKNLEIEWGRSVGAGPSSKERHLMSQISEWVSREEIMEKQRSRLDWLKDGDRNTALFQAKSKERSRSNQIKSLQTEDGSILTEQADLECCAMSFCH
jgi:hypothetical protein